MSKATEQIEEILQFIPLKEVQTTCVQILVQLAQNGKFAAARALANALNNSLGYAANKKLHACNSFEELLKENSISPLIRIYVLGYCPRMYIQYQNDCEELSKQVGNDRELDRFKTLLKNVSPLENEALKAFLLTGLVGVLRLMIHRSTIRTITDKIIFEGKVTEEHHATSDLQFGREYILNLNSTSSLIAQIAHELGHNIFDGYLSGFREESETINYYLNFSDLNNFIPELFKAATQKEGAPLLINDPRIAESSQGIRVLYTIQNLNHFNFHHISLSYKGGLLNLKEGSTFAYFLIRKLGVNPSSAALSYSPNGMIHLGFRLDKQQEDVDLDKQFEQVKEELTNKILEEADEWIEGLIENSRIGKNEADLMIHLGISRPGPVYYARDLKAVIEDHEVISSLLNNGSIPKERVDYCLNVAIRCADLQLIAALLKIGASANALTISAKPSIIELGRSLLIVEDSEGLQYYGPPTEDFFHIIYYLVQSGFDLTQCLDNDCDTLLHHTIRLGSYLVSDLIRWGANVDCRNNNDETPLYLAARKGDIETVEVLIRAKADTNTQSNNGETPLFIAVSNNHIRLASLLIASGADPNYLDNLGRSPLMVAKSEECIELLIDAGADVNAVTHDGKNALMYAAFQGDKGRISFLLNCGADLDASTDIGQTVLHYSAECGIEEKAIETIEFLLSLGLDINEETNEGITVLMIASAQTSCQLVNFLICSGANVNTKTAAGRTALMFICNGENQFTRLDFGVIDRIKEIIRCLIAAGADVNATTRNGWTALCFACLGFDATVVKLLIDVGAEVNIQTEEGYSPMSITDANEMAFGIKPVLLEAIGDHAEEVERSSSHE